MSRENLVDVSIAMKPVIQEEITGCGFAAVAVLAGITYQEVRSIAGSLGISVDDPLLWSDTRHMQALLRHFGFRLSGTEIPFVSWELLPVTALLAIKWHLEGGRPCWHWVVFSRGSDGSEVFDSRKGLRSNRRTDFGRMRPKWFIAIDGAST